MTIRVGIVEDHPVVISGLVSGLSTMTDFVIVDRAATIPDAERLLGRSDLDVALVDIRLPDGNTLEVLERSAAKPAVLILSSFDTRQYVAAAMRFGAQGFLLKTAPLDEVAAAIRHVASGGSWFSRAQLATGRAGMVDLDGRDREIIERVMRGESNDEIGRALAMSSKTVEARLSRLYERFGVMTRTELGLRAEREGWLELTARARTPSPKANG